MKSNFCFKSQKGLGDSGIVLFLRTTSPERRDQYSLRPERHKRLGRTIKKRGGGPKGGGGVCFIKVFIDLPLSGREHGPKKLIKLYET